jgi:hypothetical protein
VSNSIVDGIRKAKKALAAHKRLMESGLEEEPVRTEPKPVNNDIDMSADAMRKRDEEYRRKGWIK